MYDTLYREGLLKTIASLPGFEEETEKLRKWNGNVLMRASDLLKYQEGQFNVLNHGDLWISNIMFKNKSDGIDMRMVIKITLSCIYYKFSKFE